MLFRSFVGELDIMDTWATSSLTPQLVYSWLDDEDLFERVYPMDLRPQGQDIIRTWLFSSVVRADLEFGALPWRHAGLSGWILDSDHKKMSKSKGKITSSLYSVSLCDLTNSITAALSASEINGPCILIGLLASTGENSISPLPSSFSAPAAH